LASFFADLALGLGCLLFLLRHRHRECRGLTRRDTARAWRLRGPFLECVRHVLLHHAVTRQEPFHAAAVTLMDSRIQAVREFSRR
jgi:hypothetical protein